MAQVPATYCRLWRRGGTRRHAFLQQYRRNGCHGVCFLAVLNLTEPLYRHAEHALMSLPVENTTERHVSEKERFLSDLPMVFTRKESIEIGAKHSLSSKQVERLVGKLVEKGTLEHSAYGEYRFSTGSSR